MMRIRKHGQPDADSPAVDAFLSDLVEVYRRHGMSLAHEDGHGAFIVEPLSEANINWLNEAFDYTED